MKQKKMRTTLAKAIRKQYNILFIESFTVANAFLRDQIDKLDFEIYNDEYETVCFATNKEGETVTITFRAIQQMMETIEKNQATNRPKRYQCFVCRKTYQQEKKAIKCCSQPIVGEDDHWELPRKTASRSPLATTHTCPHVKHGGKSWSVWLRDGETCPMCHYTYLPR